MATQRSQKRLSTLKKSRKFRDQARREAAPHAFGAA